MNSPWFCCFCGERVKMTFGKEDRTRHIAEPGGVESAWHTSCWRKHHGEAEEGSHFNETLIALKQAVALAKAYLDESEFSAWAEIAQGVIEKQREPF